MYLPLKTKIILIYQFMLGKQLKIFIVDSLFLICHDIIDNVTAPVTHPNNDI